MTFGPDFSEGGEILAPFAVAIGLYSSPTCCVGYHLSRGETRYAWIVASAVVVQVVALAVIPSSLHGVVWTNVVVGVVLLAAHELFVGSSVPALRAGLGRISAGDSSSSATRGRRDGTRPSRHDAVRVRAHVASRQALELDDHRLARVGLDRIGFVLLDTAARERLPPAR